MSHTEIMPNQSDIFISLALLMITKTKQHRTPNFGGSLQTVISYFMVHNVSFPRIS